MPLRGLVGQELKHRYDTKIALYKFHKYQKYQLKFSLNSNLTRPKTDFDR
jgi:hypothetical protein